MASSPVYLRSLSTTHRSPTTSMHRAIVVNRVEKRRTVQSRSLWWWSRHGSWTTPSDDYAEDRMQKYQKVMRYRYSRALKRRAMWEREDSPPQWASRGPGRWLSRTLGYKPMSTTKVVYARLKDDSLGFNDSDKRWEEAQKDFESFKAAVDRAIAKDPVGFLFGRRLQGPASSNNSSWTSFSRIFDSKESKEAFEADRTSRNSAKRIKIENLDAKSATKSAADTTEKPSPNHDGKSSRSEDDYVYDPISGRKVKAGSSAPAAAEQASRPFLQSLFEEHGVQPVAPSDKKPAPRKFEDSRSHELNTLRASAIGNNLDTTAEYGGKYNVDAVVDKKAIKDHHSTVSDVQEDDPPFKGTTYEARHMPSIGRLAPYTEWLRNEGFKDSDAGSTKSHTSQLLTPSIDRLQSQTPPTKKRFVTKLQPSIDRIEVARDPSPKSPSSAPLLVKEVRSRPSKPSVAEIDQGEDLDLLRASDIRAATKSARITKSEVDKAKYETRSRLEADYANRASPLAEEIGSGTGISSRLSRTLLYASANSIAQHMKNYPHGIVARTLQTMNALSGSDRPSEERTSHVKGAKDETETPERTSGKPLPSNSKPTNSHVSDTIAEGTELRDNDVRGATFEAVKNANKQILEEQIADNRRLDDLARSLRDAYEVERGPIGLEPESGTGTKSSDTAKVVHQRDLHALKTATVKPGVQRFPAIERYTQEFEPKFADIRDQAKAVKRNLYEIKTSLQAVRDSTTSCSTDSHRSQLDTDVTEIDACKSPSTLTEEISNDNVVLDAEATPVESSSHASQQSDNLASTFVILTYNKKTGDVDITQLDSLMEQQKGKIEQVNPITVMGNLNYPAAFVTHFVTLEKAGYTLVNGGGDLLIFQRHARQSESSTEAEEFKAKAVESIQAIKSDIADLRNKIAKEEAISQPDHTGVPQSSGDKKAAMVLDEIPSPMPVSDPVMPTPSTSPAPTRTEQPEIEPATKRERKSRKVRRQEQVFSGTVRPVAGSHSSSARESGSSRHTSSDSTGKSKGFFRRLARAIRQTLLVTGGLGVVAYSIGVVTEGLGAQAQISQDVVVGGADAGPRKKIVMPTGQRSGIYSTESSRRE